MKLKRNYLLGSTILAGVVAMAAPALAQAQQTSAEATQVEEIVVTGSRIRRDPTTAPTPLIQVTRETVLTTGQNTVIDYLATIPALANSLVPSSTTGSTLGAGGLSFANLRALGSGRTLTLVDGRRHVGSDGGNLAVDIDTIPRLLIQNIEIVTGGASSVYGADAVSGVLNFIMRTDFEGLEVDANYGEKNQDGQANKRISALIGQNFFDDRLNVYAFGEYEELDEVRTNQIDWLARSQTLVSTDADPVAAPYDGITDTTLFSNLRTMQRLRWGIVNLANNQPASALNNPNIPFNNCGTVGGVPSAANYTNTNCTALNPGYSYVFDGATARLANFGERVGTGLQRVLNIGGDGELASEYGQYSQVPRSESQRYQVGGNFKVTSNINAHAEVKYVTEETYFEGQPTFFDIFISDRYGTGVVSPIRTGSAYDIRLSDNAYMPDNLKAAILANRINIYSQPTATQPGQLTGTAAAPYARSALRGPDRNQTNTRDLWRGVISFDGNHDQIGFVKNVSWDVGYTYGQVEVANRETGVDVERMAFASDAIRNSAGQIVCRVQNLQATATPTTVITDAVRGGDLRDTAAGRAAINDCKPLNVFGAGNQSAEALNYLYAQVGVTERNEQEQGLATVSGQLWDFWGAGPLGLALGYEHRREMYEATGRDRETAGRLLFLNTGADRSPVQYKSDEVFAELSVPLFRDSVLVEYAELSGSYRYFDYTTTGTGDVYGVNFVYRPIQDIAFKTSYNTSLRVPNLSENFSAYSATYSFFGSDDPCTTANINAAANVQYRDNRIKNCTALAALQGLTFDFAGATPITTDDFGPAYGTGSIEGVSGGNPNLKPEESSSFTFSTVLKPRFIPNFSLVLDYYEIEIKDVIATVTPQVAAQNCVNGPSLNADACATIFRNNPNVPFGVGAPAGTPLGGYISSSLNYAKRTTRGLDFDARYSFDMDEMFGRNWGRIDYSIRGTWLIEQKNFNNAQNPFDYTGLDSTLTGGVVYPRTRFTSSFTYSPDDRWSINWSVDWQTAVDIVQARTFVNNADSRLTKYMDTGNFARHDFTVRYKVRDDLTLRAGVVNAFDAEQAPWLGYTLYPNYDPYGTRYFFGINYRPW